MKQTEFAHVPSINIQMVREKEVLVHPLKLWDGSEKNGQNFLRS
jgi:hypothetical protein